MKPFAIVMASVISFGCLNLPSIAAAEERTRGWIGVGLGVGSFGPSVGNEGGRDAVAVAFLGMGGSLDKRWLIGADVGGHDSNLFLEDLPEPVTLTFILGTVAFYPRRSSGFYVKGGAGALTADTEIVDEFGTKASANVGIGSAFMAATGWDVHLGRRFWLTPAINYRYGHLGRLVLAGTARVADWNHHLVDFTIGVKFD